MPQWTADEARQNSIKGHQASIAARKRMAEREKLLDSLIAQATSKLAEPKDQPSQATQNPYATVQIARCEEQIASLWTKLADADSAADSDRYASAIARLSEVRRVLAREPLPGSERPQAPRRAIAVFTPPADS